MKHKAAKSLVVASLVVTGEVMAVEPDVPRADGLAKHAAALLLTNPEVTFPMAFQTETRSYTRKKTKDVWFQFEQDHAVEPGSGPLAEPFYGLCVMTQQLKLWENDVSRTVDRFDAGVSEALFGRDDEAGTSSGKRKSSREFFGRPRFDTILPTSARYTKMRGDDFGSDRMGRSRGRHNIQIGFRIEIPFGSR